MTAIKSVSEIPRRSVLIDMATRFGMEPSAFEKTLRATVVPANCSQEQFAAFLLVAKQYDLNPLTKEIYAYPTRTGGIQPIVSIDGWANLINSHPQTNGIEFDDNLADGKLISITARIWRKDRDKPCSVTEYLSECDNGSQPWKKWPRRMLRHKALIQCARYAFGFAGIVDPDEADRISSATAPARPIESTPVASDQDDGPPTPPPALIEGKVVWEETGERPATVADVLDHAQWLKEIDGALAGCEDFDSAGMVQKNLILPQRGIAFPPDWDRATEILNEHLARIGESSSETR